MIEQDKKIVEDLFKQEEYVRVIHKYLVSPDEPLNTKLKGLSNERLGELVKADMFAKETIRARWSNFKKDGKSILTGVKSDVPE